jgi:hypothetical protein
MLMENAPHASQELISRMETVLLLVTNVRHGTIQLVNAQAVMTDGILILENANTLLMHLKVDKEVNKQVDLKVDKQVNRQMNRQMNKEMDKQVNRQMNRQMNKEMDNQVNRQVDKQVDKQVNKKVDQVQVQDHSLLIIIVYNSTLMALARIVLLELF